MTYLENILMTVFSGDVGLSDEGIQRALQSIRANPDTRELNGLREEIQALLRDHSADWILLLDNKEYEVAYFESQEDAKAFIVENVWNPLFPESAA